MREVGPFMAIYASFYDVEKY